MNPKWLWLPIAIACASGGYHLIENVILGGLLIVIGIILSVYQQILECAQGIIDEQEDEDEL